jgi:hypothetical protein
MECKELNQLIDKEERFLAEVENNLAESKKSFQEAQQKANVAQIAFQSAQNELNIWTGAANAIKIRLERLRQQVEQEQPKEPSLDKPTAGLLPSANDTLRSIAESSGSQDVNKTEMIRSVLRRHPAGITPAELWRELNGEVSRDYVYAVLKRLKDRDQISYRRKKYSLRDVTGHKTLGNNAPATLQ